MSSGFTKIISMDLSLEVIRPKNHLSDLLAVKVDLVIEVV